MKIISIYSKSRFHVSDVPFAERVMGQPTGSDNYRGYDVSIII